MRRCRRTAFRCRSGFYDQLGVPDFGEVLRNDWVDHDSVSQLWSRLLLLSSVLLDRSAHIRAEH